MSQVLKEFADVGYDELTDEVIHEYVGEIRFLTEAEKKTLELDEAF